MAQYRHSFTSRGFEAPSPISPGAVPKPDMEYIDQQAYDIADCPSMFSSLYSFVEAGAQYIGSFF